MNSASVYFSSDDRLNEWHSSNGTITPCIHNFESYLVPYLRWLIPILSITGVLGNALILIIFNSRGMRSKTSFILSAMAVADLAHAVVAMFTGMYLYERVIDSDAFNRLYHRIKPILMTLVNWMAMTSTWLAVAVTVERFIAIRYPFEAVLIIRKRRVVQSTFIIVLISLIVCSYLVIWLRPVHVADCDSEHRTVYRLLPDPSLHVYGHIARQFHSLLSTVVPIALLFYYNGSLVYYLRRNRDPTLHQLTQSRRFQRSTSHDKPMIDDAPEYKVALVVISISLSTACLLSPSAVIVVYDAFRFVSGRSITTPAWYAPVNDISNTLVLTQKVLDFGLYCFSSSAFRRRLTMVMFSNPPWRVSKPPPRKPTLASQHRKSLLTSRRSRSHQNCDRPGAPRYTVHYQRVISEDGSIYNQNHNNEIIDFLNGTENQSPIEIVSVSSEEGQEKGHVVVSGMEKE